jgi:hypothetical protein
MYQELKMSLPVGLGGGLFESKEYRPLIIALTLNQQLTTDCDNAL